MNPLKPVSSLCSKNFNTVAFLLPLVFWPNSTSDASAKLERNERINFRLPTFRKKIFMGLK